MLSRGTRSSWSRWSSRSSTIYVPEKICCKLIKARQKKLIVSGPIFFRKWCARATSFFFFTQGLHAVHDFMSCNGKTPLHWRHIEYSIWRQCPATIQTSWNQDYFKAVIFKKIGPSFSLTACYRNLTELVIRKRWSIWKLEIILWLPFLATRDHQHHSPCLPLISNCPHKLMSLVD